MFKTRLRRGFTLIELLVVLAIMAVLLAAAAFSFTDSLEVKRDAERKADLRLLQNAIELYKQEYGRYPAGCRGAGNWSGGSYGCPAGSPQYIMSHDTSDPNINFSPKFISALPYDPKPKGNEGYVYVTNADGSVYKLMAMGTVESERVHYCSEFASCDTKYRGPENAGDTNAQLTNNLNNFDGYSDCANMGPSTLGGPYSGMYVSYQAPGIGDPEKYGWCDAWDTNPDSGATPASGGTLNRCKMNTGIFRFGSNNNDRFETSYGVWGGVAEPNETNPNTLLNRIEDTTNIICK